ncbi:hypothetical protein ACS5PN_07265 [Roseateles sp. NT4]|uniref:hypothetical protein n=1 Tax=Roseateles sp. NT4 TaxID=3453715 RepID=UPI003EED77A9
MIRYEFALAQTQDDAQLRACMAQVWMEGRMAVSFRREPSYFAGCRMQGDAVQVIKCTDSQGGRIIGMGGRSTLRAHVNGRPTRVGYLSDLRGLPEVRRGTLLARGYRFLHELHRREPLPFYLSVIFDGNEQALSALLGARAGLPVYTPLGRILTPALQFDFARAPLSVEGVNFARAGEAALPEIVSFLAEQLPRRQFSPVIAAADFADGGRLAGLRARDFFIARRQGRLVACLAAWDQSAIRQTHIERYPPGLALARPFINLASRLSPLKPLPAPGGRVAHLYFCLATVAGDELPVFRGLLRHAYNALRTGPWHYAILGLHESDPLTTVFDDYRCIAAAGQLFVVHYPEDGDPMKDLDMTRIPGVEMALA